MKKQDKYNEFKGSISILNHTTGEVYEKKNLVCNGFYDLVADRMINNNENFITHFAIGDDNTPVSITDTAMGNEIYRKEITNSSSVGSNISFETEIVGNEALGNWEEIGLFNAASAGVLTNHTNVSFTHNAGDVLTITWEIERS